MSEYNPGSGANPAVQTGNNLPVLNVAGWSVLDFELAFEGLRQVNDATIWLQNQPRAMTDHSLHPGADFIASLGEVWCSNAMTQMMDHLAELRFADPADEERRIILLLHYATQWGPSAEPLASILAMVAKQMKKQ
jgi:hypothetical protein